MGLLLLIGLLLSLFPLTLQALVYVSFCNALNFYFLSP